VAAKACQRPVFDSLNRKIEDQEKSTSWWQGGAKMGDGFLTFERIEMEGRGSNTVFVCEIKSLLNGKVVELRVRLELPHSDKMISEIQHDIASAIHEATDPARLSQ
jgi:hypothetical protein